MAFIVMTLVGNIRYDGRVRKEISTLTSAGHHVELIVTDFSGDISGGEDLNITIHYIPSTIGKTPLGSFYEQLLFNLRAAKKIRQLKPDFVHCHDLTALISGVISKSSNKFQLIYDAHELLPESMGGIKQKIWGSIEKLCVRYCDQIIMPEKNRITYFGKKYKPKSAISLLENFPKKQDLPDKSQDLLRKAFNIPNDRKIVLHTGALAPGRFVEELIEGINRSSERIVLVLLGISFKGYDNTLKQKIEALRLKDRVFLHGPVQHADILNFMASCDIGTAFYRNTNLNNYYCASNKLYENIALNKPVITNDYPGLVEVVQAGELGYCLTEVNAESLARAFKNAAFNQCVGVEKKRFFWEDQENALLDIYRAENSDNKND